MVQSIKCIHCGAVMKTANPVAPGKKVKCPKCAKVFAVPEEEEAEDEVEDSAGAEQAADEQPTKKPDKKAKDADDADDEPEEDDGKPKKPPAKKITNLHAKPAAKPATKEALKARPSASIHDPDVDILESLVKNVGRDQRIKTAVPDTSK